MKASIIIPSYNAKERLYNNLIALNCQDYPFKDFEVIVIDNGSTDHTAEMLSAFQSRYSLINVRVEKNRGIAYGRNQGIVKASGDILIFHDSDMIATKDFVRKHIEAHQEANTVICGLCWKRIYSFYYKYFDPNQQNHFKQYKTQYRSSINLNKKNVPLITEEQITDGSFLKYSFDLENPIISSMKETIRTHGNDLDGYLFPWRYFLTNNSSVNRNKVLEVGLFDEKNENWGFEDFDLAIRLYKSGCKFKLRSDIINVHQEHPLKYSLTEFKESLHYMFEKYNDIKHLDMLLILLTITTTIVPPVKSIINEKNLNELMKDINKMMESKENLDLLHLFRELLQMVRKKHLNQIQSNQSTKSKMDWIKSKLQESELQKKLGRIHFVNGLYSLIRELN